MTVNTLGVLTPQQAWDLMQENPRAVLVDIRSSMEYLFVGHPVGAVHVAWIDEPDWTVNPDFSREIRSGKRSHEAGELLINEGLQQVYHIDEGFEGERDEDYHRSTIGGWRFRGLPWEQC